MDHGLTFNGGVMLVSPHIGIFDILHKDCQQASNWHYSTSYPESHYLQWIADWRFLAQSLNLCPRMGKGQANTRDWQHLSWREVEIFHYSTQSKPYYWFKQGTIDTCCNIASGMSDELVVSGWMTMRCGINLVGIVVTMLEACHSVLGRIVLFRWYFHDADGILSQVVQTNLVLVVL